MPSLPIGVPSPRQSKNTLSFAIATKNGRQATYQDIRSKIHSSVCTRETAQWCEPMNAKCCNKAQAKLENQHRLKMPQILCARRPKIDFKICTQLHSIDYLTKTISCSTRASAQHLLWQITIRAI